MNRKLALALANQWEAASAGAPLQAPKARRVLSDIHRRFTGSNS